jgi:protease I
MKKVVMIIAPRNFRDEELFVTKEVLESAGFEVTIASKTMDTCVGMLGGEVKPDITNEQVNPEDYDAVVFVGGSGSSVYFNDETAKGIAKEAYEKGKVIGAICIAPSILANAGLLQGKKVTSFASEQGNLESKGAEYTGNSVERDGKIITADGPESAREFGKTIAESL